MLTGTSARVFEAHARVYRRTWRASVISAFLNPVLFLLAMGLGLGALVDRGGGPADLGGITYLDFLAPGLLAATLMQTGAGDAAWPVMAGIKWVKTYHAALATPVGIRDLVLGHLAWVTARLTFTAVVFTAVMALFGSLNLPGGMLAVLPAVLTGMAFAAPVTAFTASLERETGLTSMFRFGIVPMFLFSGTFFPVSQLPDWMEPAAYVTPLWHGVELTRAAALGLPPVLAPGWHVAYLAGWVLIGGWLAIRQFRRRLEQ